MSDNVKVALQCYLVAVAVWFVFPTAVDYIGSLRNKFKKD